ncbi:trimeric intracellular cation channel family protein [Dinoroseobacter sp. S76]|uniref:trimeric intracellular cation channel family protein n=1 Tax=Dinoroseobacter sp. S76 TaxID=3415124 RepID=UPI003C7BD71E
MLLTSLGPIVFALTVLATGVMAASAAIQGARQGFDPFGATVLAIVTAVGGGTLRDILIGRFPVFWINDLTYLATAIPVALLTFLAARRMRAGGGRRLRLLLYLDAVGLALFTLVGVQIALGAGLSPVIAVILGCTTGVAGGMIRDVLCGLQPSILKEDLYATISLGGGTVFVIWREALSPETGLMTAFALMTAARFFVVWRTRPKDEPLA